MIRPVVGRDELSGLTGGEVVMADVRSYLDGRSGRAAYDAGHITGAVFVDLDADLAAAPSAGAGRHPLPTAEHFASAMGRLGIGLDDVVVAYDDSGGATASRLVWMLRSLGQPAALLDGGLASWPATDLSTEPVVRPEVQRPIVEWPAGLVVSADDVATLGAGSMIVDARAAERYRGEIEPIDLTAGHIPGAVNIPFAGNLDDDGRFLPPAELAGRYRDAGVTAGSDVIVYCGSGVTACHDLLAIERAGLGRGRLYAGSWSQWSSDPARPVATGDPAG